MSGHPFQSLMDKVCAREDIAARMAALPKPVVFTNGVFDVLHRGHVAYLHEARQLGGSLVVAVNSDASARMLGKGPDRPLNKAEDRAAVLAGLASVSLVTFFDERTPVALIKDARPDLYVKGGDYDMETLEETAVVRSWGGEALAIPFVDGYSTTSLVKRIRAGQSSEAVPQASALTSPRKAAFLDRDGVINLDRAYVHQWDEFEFVPGAVDAMRRLREAGYVLIVVTNQSGLARGMYTEDQFQVLTTHMRTALKEAGAEVEAVYHCPHHPKGTVPELAVDCDCRKPEPGMILRAAREHGLSLADSFMVGDKPSDIEAARAAGVGRAYIVRSDNAESVDGLAGADAAHADLAACVDALLKAR
ncbi:rfaE bifunctional protein nucleotidyltransferase chain/domain [Aquabacterium commune]|uniref:D-glycero-beta-D-manno-heptose 1-phosphate adenylyltransferase n=1 Tax=Aquabacterium commune TaxID=70586 RepID=A0A4R6RP59_9BURK|nr:rfaE bifunctional protein nucleotidyltransferase chain/domain [Aquabacterium commune]